MNILALETTQSVASVAALQNDRLLDAFSLDPEQRSAQSLAVGLKSLLDSVGWRSHEIDLVAVVQGPGSFTGLRVGVVTAKTFAYAAEAEILGVDTLEVLAAGVTDDIERLSVAVDAQRGQVVCCQFHRLPNGKMKALDVAERIDSERWLDSLPEGIAITGPILPKLLDRTPESVQLLDQRYWFPRAEHVGRLAWRQYQEGRRDTIWDLVPHYSRQSAAEEQWHARQRPPQG